MKKIGSETHSSEFVELKTDERITIIDLDHSHGLMTLGRLGGIVPLQLGEEVEISSALLPDGMKASIFIVQNFRLCICEEGIVQRVVIKAI